MKQARRTAWVGVFLAIRSLVRGNIGTTVMTTLMMAMIFINLVFLTAIINGLTATAHSQIIHALTSDVLIEAPAGETFIQNADDVEREIMHVQHVRNISPRTNFSAELEFSGNQGSFRGVAIHPAAEASVTNVEDHMVEGRYLEATDTNAIIIGNQIAGNDEVETELYAYSLKGAHAGDSVTLRYSNGLEKTYEVVGVFDTDFVQSDNRFFISKTEYESLFPQLQNSVSEFAVDIDSTIDVDAVAQDMHNRNDGAYSVRTWKDTAGIVESFTASFDIVNVIVSIVALVVAGITIFIVMYIDVVNRRRQIGILRAIGIAEGSIAISYLLRALLYALVGVVVGMLLFKFALIPLFQAKPLHLPVGYVSLVIDNTLLYVRGLALLIVALFGAFIPVQKTLRMHIINAIWGE